MFVIKKTWSMAWICWKDVYVLLSEIQKTCFLAKTTVILLQTYTHYEHWLIITVSWEDLAAVIFVINKFMCSCVICLVRDLSEISRGEGRWKQREGHNFLRLRKGRGHEKWAVKRGRVMQIHARDHVEAHPRKKKEVLYLVKKKKKNK